MTSPTRRLSALWITSPAEAAQQVSAALVRAKSARQAARDLGVGASTLNRWIHARPELEAFRLTDARK